MSIIGVAHSHRIDVTKQCYIWYFSPISIKMELALSKFGEADKTSMSPMPYVNPTID
jgi:hypothetical protein